MGVFNHSHRFSKNVWKYISYKNMSVNKIYREELNFGYFKFGEFSKLAKIGKNISPPKKQLYGILKNWVSYSEEFHFRHKEVPVQVLLDFSSLRIKKNFYTQALFT